MMAPRKDRCLQKVQWHTKLTAATLQNHHQGLHCKTTTVSPIHFRGGREVGDLTVSSGELREPEFRQSHGKRGSMYEKWVDPAVTCS